MITDIRHNNIEKSEGYYALFGNQISAWPKHKGQSLQAFWRKCVKSSFFNSVGDVSLYYNGKLIRSIWNANQPILRKDVPFKLTINKYET